jgi:hypothetical protein
MVNSYNTLSPRNAIASLAALGAATLTLTSCNSDSNTAALERAEGCHSITVGQYTDKDNAVVSNVPDNIRAALTDPTEVGLLTANLDDFNGVTATGLAIQADLGRQHFMNGEGHTVMGGDVINFCINSGIIRPDTEDPSHIATF